MKSAFIYGPYVMLVVAFAAFVLRCRLRVRAQAIWAAVLLACFSKFLCYDAFGGDAFNPDMPERVVWLWNWAYSGAVILGALAVLTVPFRFPLRVFVLPLLAWGLSACGVRNGVVPPVVREVSLAYDDLPDALNGFRIVQLSDLHISSAARQWRTRRIVETANACTGDVVVITGDIVDGLPPARLYDVMPLRRLRARAGVFAITGNHEVYYDVAEWMPWYEQWGIRFLNNECVFPRKELALGGVDERAFPQLHPGEECESICPSVLQAFAHATNGAFRVLLQHRPGHAEENARIHGVRLQLSGHTHGGVFPGMAWIVAKFNKGFVRGLYSFQNAQTRSYAYVSPGSGQWAGFPLRFFNPTEITVFTLRRSSPSHQQVNISGRALAPREPHN